MEQLLTKVKTYDFGQSRVALTELGDKIREAHGNEAETQKIEAGLIDVLNSDAKFAGKQWACRKLSIIGSDACVPALAKMLTNEKEADMARYALERIPGRDSGMALAGALEKTSVKTRIGIINTIGERRWPGSARGLAKYLDADAETAGAAAAALGKIGGPDAITALKAAKNKTKGDLRMQVMDAYLQCADKLVAEGKSAEAMAIYNDLSKDAPTLIKQAALRGKVNALKKR